MGEIAKEVFAEWAILELMGHRKLAGMVTEKEIAGQLFVRVDIFRKEGPIVTQFYSPGAVYCITPTTEEIARAVDVEVRPVTQWEFKSPEVGNHFDKEIADDVMIDPERDFEREDYLLEAEIGEE